MDSSEARDLLARERARIEGALGELAKPEGDEEGVTFDSGDVAPALLGTEIDVGLEASLREELAAIERAERRLAEGRYGLSIESGEPIPDGRLRSIPWAERTAEEQARLESGR
ncbi:MAG TPA: TraR/DksA C4-type zinc finger protein [Solirubrobacteraceae bacterium]|nr:TraR/DksA C4-type zinc finger protein [Solirubrobacteraceae bacterium]